MLQHLKAWWATHVTLIAAVVGFFDPSVQTWMAQHQQGALLIGGAWSLLLHHLQPPRNFANGNGKSSSLGSIGIILFLLLALLAFPSGIHAQNPLPDRPPATVPDAPRPQNFVVSASAANSSGNIAMMMASGGFQITEYYSVSYSQIWNPSNSSDLRWKLGDFNGTYQLSDLLPESIKKALVFDPSNFIVTFQGSAGKVTGINPKTGLAVNHIAEGLGIYCSRPFNNHTQLTMGYRFLHGVNGATWVKVPAAGFNWTFNFPKLTL